MEEQERLLVEYILEKNVGSIIRHDDIEDLLLMRRGGKYYGFMRKVEKTLMLHDRGLKTLKGVGYQILGPEAIVDRALKMVQASSGKVENALGMLNHIDRESLNQEYKMKFDLIHMKFVNIHQSLAGGVKEVFLLSNPKNEKKNRLSNMK